MRVLVFAAYYPPCVGGYAKNVHEWARRLASKGHEVHVVTCAVGPAASAPVNEVVAGVSVSRLPARHLLAETLPVPRLTHVLKLLRNTPDSDVVVTQTRFFPTSLLGALYAKRHKKPLVHVERGSCHTQSEKWWLAVFATIYDHTFGWWLTRAANTNVAVSRAGQAFLEHIGATSVRVIHNGVNAAPSDATRSVEAAHGSNAPHWGRNYRIACVGRLIHAKGVQDLLDALRTVRGRTHRKIDLYVAGDGNYRSTLERRTALRSFPERTHFLGELDGAEVYRLLASCDCFANPSHSEGLPTTVLEAASLGLPVIATSVGGTSEIIEHEVTGLLVPPRDPSTLASAVLRYIADDADASRMGRAAKEHVKRTFCWRTTVAQWERLLKEVTHT